MQPPVNMVRDENLFRVAQIKIFDWIVQHETLDGYLHYFHGIVGFFVVEDHVMNTASSLVNRSYLEDVWNIAATQIASSIRTHSVL